MNSFTLTWGQCKRATNRGSCWRTDRSTWSRSMNSVSLLLSLNPTLPVSLSLSFITAFLTLVCVACTNSCPRPAAALCPHSTSHSSHTALPIILHSLFVLHPFSFSSSRFLHWFFQFHDASFLSSTCLWSVKVPSPHSIVSDFLCTRLCFLLPSKFRPEQDITKSHCMPNMMSWLSWVCLKVCVCVCACFCLCVRVSSCVSMYFYVDNNKKSRPDVSSLIRKQSHSTDSVLFTLKGMHSSVCCSGKQGRCCLALASGCPLRWIYLNWEFPCPSLLLCYLRGRRAGNERLTSLCNRSSVDVLHIQESIISPLFPLFPFLHVERKQISVFIPSYKLLANIFGSFILL